MNFQIIGDSCMDLTPLMQKDKQHFAAVPLMLIAGDKEIPDDASFDQASFLELIRSTPSCPRTACPSPEDFKNAFVHSAADYIFVITLSEQLSGTCNAARLGKELYEESCAQAPKKVAIINSFSGCAAETRLALLVYDLCNAGKSFEEIAAIASSYAEKRLQTFFVLQTLDTLRKNGRLSGSAALFAYVLNLKPVLFADRGEIKKFSTARGMEKALEKMCDAAIQNAVSHGVPVSDDGLPCLDRAVLVYCSCLERAEAVKALLEKRAHFQHIDLAPARGVSTVYAADGGIVLAI